MSKVSRYLLKQVSVEFATAERCSIIELWNVASDNAVSVARCKVAAGVTTQLHSLAVHERYVIESGTGIMELDRQQTYRLQCGHTVDILPKIAQRVYNDGATDDLVFLAICTPAFMPQHYNDLEQGAVLPPPELT